MIHENYKLKSLLDTLTEDKSVFELSEKDVVKYNCCDHPNHLTGEIKNGKATVIYSLYAINIEKDLGFAQNINAWGRYLECTVTLSKLVPIK